MCLMPKSSADMAIKRLDKQLAELEEVWLSTAKSFLRNVTEHTVGSVTVCRTSCESQESRPKYTTTQQEKNLNSRSTFKT